MHRRSLLAAVALVVAPSAGCLSSDDGGPESGDGARTAVSGAGTKTATDDGPSPTTTAMPDVRVVVTRPAPGPTSSRVVVDADGTITVRLDCGDGTVERRASLPPDDHRSFAQFVVEADVASMADRYDCAGDCPVDAPGRRYAFTVDGETTTVFVEAEADGVPADLERIRERLAAFRDAVETPTCGGDDTPRPD